MTSVKGECFPPIQGKGMACTLVDATKDKPRAGMLGREGPRRAAEPTTEERANG